MTITLRPCAGEAELADPTVTGAFASDMADIASQVHVPPWCGYIGWCDDTPMGFGGFKGPPDAANAVEIGYLTFARHEGRGVAKAVAAAMIAVARSHKATTVLAHTLCEENASTGVLRANGFVRDGFGEDPDEGQVWRWTLALS